MEECYKNRQGMSFAGVNAYHQNGIAERRIKELQELARTMLIHGNHRWDKAIAPNLRPYAIQMTNDIVNYAPSFYNKEKRFLSQTFVNTNTNINPKHWKPFGCLLYVLNPSLQNSKPYHKWKKRAKPSIYFGRSPQHNQNVGLVLDLTTGLVSP